VRSARAVLAGALLLLASAPACATFHLWFMSQVYSNASGTVQFLEMTALAPGQQFLAGHTLAVTGGVSHTFNIPSNLPGDSANRRVLFGTAGFAALNVVQPDYIVPDNFFPTRGGATITWGEGADVWHFTALPENGVLALNRDTSTSTNAPVNFAGQTGTVKAVVGIASSPNFTMRAATLNSGIGPTTSTSRALSSSVGDAISTGLVTSADHRIDSGFNITTAVPTGHLANISTRMQVLTGANVMIAGFIVGGSTSKTVAITATGPSLVPFGISNFLANPQLTLVRSSDQSVVASNDDWQSDPNAAQLTASGFAPASPSESGLYVNLPPGAYTAIVQGAGGSTGVSVAGVFEVDHPEVPLTNISTRGLVQTGANVMIAGLIVQGTAPKTVVISATGPSLAPFGIANYLANPTLTLVRSSDQSIIATNDDWQSAPNAAAIQASGFAPGNPAESAVMVTLDPGAYTAIVQGAAGGVGVSVVGVFGAP